MKAPYTALVISLCIAVSRISAAPINVYFVNESGYSNNQVYIAWQNALAQQSTFDVSYGAGSTPFSFGNASNSNVITTNTATLDSLGSSGMSMANVASGVLFISFGTQLASTTNGPSITGSGATDYLTPYQPLEVNYSSNSTSGGGDLTYINVLTAPLRAATYTGGTNGTLLQNKGLTTSAASTASLISQVTAISGVNSNFIYNTNGNLVRIAGPGNYNPPAAFSQFPVMTEYLNHLQSNSVVTAVSNYNTFANSGTSPATTTNYRFYANMGAKITNNYQAYLSGEITTYQWTTNFSEGTAGPTFTNATILVDATDATNFTALAYAAAQPGTNIIFGGNGWNDFYSFVGSNGINGASNTFPQVPLADYYAALIMGLAGSTVTNTASGDTMAIKDYATGHYWHNWTNPISFSDVQTNPDFYDQYGDVIYRNSTNTAYGYAYSDRFDYNSVLFTLGQLGPIGPGTNFDTLVITIGVPTNAIPEATTALYLTLGLVGFAVFMTNRRRVMHLTRKVALLLF